MLNFDPRQWLADNCPEDKGRTVATVATVAVASLKNEFSNSRVTLATVATVATLSGWQHSFVRLDPCQPPEGFTMRRWQQLYDDSLWILEAHGSHACQNGWTAADLFGLWPDKPHWGGIADRLRGARSLVMDADRASWRSWGQVERFNRGSYPHLRPFWEVKQ